MIYLLDTNTCIRYLNGRSPGILRHMQSVPSSDIALCSVVKAELSYGAAKNAHPLAIRTRQQLFLAQFVSLPFDDDAAERYGEIRADLANRGLPIGPNDLLIAAIALANNLILVTHNVGEFSRVIGLQLVDWETS